MKENIVTIILILSKPTVSQYDSAYNAIQQAFQYNPYVPYQTYPNQVIQNKWNDQEQDNINYKDYNDYEEICDCGKCADLKPGCLNSCPNCISTPQPMFPQNYVILPFPYPYPMTPKEAAPVRKETQTNTTTSTTTEATIATIATVAKTAATNKEARKITEITTSEAIEAVTDSDMTMSPFHTKPKRPYLITSIRRTKPNWVPKYGIVPIPDTFAERLMLQLRSMKVLHPHKNDARNVGEMSPLK